MSVYEGPLGRRAPSNYDHVSKYPLSALPTIVQPDKVPVVLGIDWYANFDSPVMDPDGTFWIGRDLNNLGVRRGGHALAAEPQAPGRGLWDRLSWWYWYDQVSEGICVSEAVCRAQSLMNRVTYQPRPLYDEAQLRDPFPGEDYDGTLVSAGLDVARTKGLIRARKGERHRLEKGALADLDSRWDAGQGIVANRWATSVDEVLQVLGQAGRDYIILLNSWGNKYPHRVRMPAETLGMLMQNGAEVGIVTDR